MLTLLYKAQRLHLSSTEHKTIQESTADLKKEEDQYLRMVELCWIHIRDPYTDCTY